MYWRNPNWSIAYKCLMVALCVFGQVVMIATSERWWSLYFYYTNLSNLLCLGYFVGALWHGVRTRQGAGPEAFAPRFKGAVVMAITVTMLIYWFLLVGSGFSMGPVDGEPYEPSPISAFNDYVVHLLVPLGTILDWGIFDPKGRYRMRDPLLWLVVPLVYWGWTIIVAQTGFTYLGGARYPYFFIDPDLVGRSGVAGYVAALIGVFAVLGYLVLGLDRLLARAGRRFVPHT